MKGLAGKTFEVPLSDSDFTCAPAAFAPWLPLLAIFTELGLTPESTEFMDILAGRGDPRGVVAGWEWHPDDPYGGACWIREAMPQDAQGFRIILLVHSDYEWSWQALVQDQEGKVSEDYISLQGGGARAMMDAADLWWTLPENQAGMVALIQEAQKVEGDEDATA